MPFWGFPDFETHPKGPTYRHVARRMAGTGLSGTAERAGATESLPEAGKSRGEVPTFLGGCSGTIIFPFFLWLPH